MQPTDRQQMRSAAMREVILNGSHLRIAIPQGQCQQHRMIERMLRRETGSQQTPGMTSHLFKRRETVRRQQRHTVNVRHGDCPQHALPPIVGCSIELPRIHRDGGALQQPHHTDLLPGRKLCIGLFKRQIHLPTGAFPASAGFDFHHLGPGRLLRRHGAALCWRGDDLWHRQHPQFHLCQLWIIR